MKPVVFRPATWPDTVSAAVRRLRRNAFGAASTTADPRAGSEAPQGLSDRLEDELDPFAYQIVLFRDEEVVGAGRINLLADYAPAWMIDRYRLAALGENYAAQSAVSTRLVVAPQFRRTHAPVLLASQGLKIVRAHACRWCVIGCDPSLAGFFERMGFEPHADYSHNAEAGGVCVLKYDVAAPRRKTRAAQKIAAA